MCTPRRSSRIKAKEEEKLSISASLRSKRKRSGRKQLKRAKNVVLESSSEEEEAWHGSTSEEEEQIDPSTLISPITKQHKPNNFFKIHSSYNFDRGGLDTYERDFIDDTHILTPLKRHSKYRRKGTAKRVKDSEKENDGCSSDSSDGIGIRRTRHTSDSKRRVLNASSSDSEGNDPIISPQHGDQPKVNKEPLMKGKARDTPSDSDEEPNIPMASTRRRKKLVSLNSDTDEGNSEDDVKKRGSNNGEVGKRKRRRLLKQPESDDEISIMEPSMRGSSGRAIKLQKEKERERQKKLRRLRASRGVKGIEAGDHSCSDSQASDDNKEETPDDYNIRDQEVDVIMEAAAETFSDIFTPPPPTAETILFPVQDEGSSEEEESDWIVSSEDSGEEMEDLNVVLAQLRKPSQPIMYHFEAGCKETDQCIMEDDESGEVGVDGSDALIELDTRLPLHEILLESGAGRERESEGEGEGGGVVEKEDASTVAKLRKVLPKMRDQLETTDPCGCTAVMVAADQGDSEALELLLEAGANINCQDPTLTTPLHLAALSGWVECVNVLISRGHPVDCRDSQGWPPLLYAHFQGHHECVLALMKANPKQLSVLRDLLRRTQNHDPEIRRRTVKVVRSLLMSLAHHEAYYTIFNEFVGQNLSVLDEDGFSFMKHCMALLSFENKQAWLKAKLQKLREYAKRFNNQYSCGLSLYDLTRGNLLDTVQERITNVSPAQCWIGPPGVSFKGEPGICTGPRREFWACLCKDLASGDHKLFTQCDEGHLSLQPCSVFSKYFSSVLPRLVVEKHKQLLHSVGSLMACAVFHQDTLSLSLSKPLLKQLGGLSLSHPDDLEHVDQAFHRNMTVQLKELDDISDLELTFTQTLSCPWSGQTVDVAIKEGGRACTVSNQNKEEYIKSVSQFKLETAIEQELEAFLSGFWEVIPQKCLNVFSPDELSLLISGVPSIDVDDWSRNTEYHGLAPDDDIVIWFWKLVCSLKEEEKALLLKFATGSPRAPAGGFSTLQGLGGPTKFNVNSMPGMNKIPQASTCFNMLKLSDYSCEQELRNKILIAIRYGCEGFAFS